MMVGLVVNRAGAALWAASVCWLCAGTLVGLGNAQSLAGKPRALEAVGASSLDGLPIPKDAVRFIDGVRCGDPAEPHDVLHFGKPSRVETILGRPARVAAGAWEVFGYTLNIQEPSKPHVIVLTYPDDTWRRVHFRVWGPQGGYAALRAGLSTVHAASWKINTNSWAKVWTPLLIPGGKGSQVRILFADSRVSRSLAPNHQGPKVLEPWAVGEIMLYEVTDPQKLLPPLTIAHPVKPGEERYIGLAGLGYSESYLRDAANKDYLKLYLRHIGVNFLRVAGGQGGPPFGRPEFETQLTLLDELGVKTSFSCFKYFNAFLRDRLKTNTLPQELIDTMPKRVREAIDSLGGWEKPDALYEGGSYQARLMVMPLNWLDEEMGSWLEKLARHFVTPAARHQCVAWVQFFGTGQDEVGEERGGQNLAKAVGRFSKVVRSIRDDLMVEVPSMYINLRARERANLPVPYAFDYYKPYTTTDEKGKQEIHDRTGLYERWPGNLSGVVGGMAGSLWRGFHVPPPGLAILDSSEALSAVRRFNDGWFAQFRIFEQNESESPKGIGWMNDYYAWAGPAYRANIVRIMAANPRYVIIDNGHEGPGLGEIHLRMLAGAWRAFPWGKAEDLSAVVAPPNSNLKALKCRGRLLLLNLDPATHKAKLPVETAVDAVSGAPVSGGTVVLEPFEARTLIIEKQ